MLEETRLDYALVTVFVEVWISIGLCRRLLPDDGQSLTTPVVIPSGKPLKLIRELGSNLRRGGRI
jgi:hypothetical protein